MTLSSAEPYLFEGIPPDAAFTSPQHQVAVRLYFYQFCLESSLRIAVRMESLLPIEHAVVGIG
jgi:hypothetical protein